MWEFLSSLFRTALARPPTTFTGSDILPEAIVYLLKHGEPEYSNWENKLSRTYLMYALFFADWECAKQTGHRLFDVEWVYNSNIHSSQVFRSLGERGDWWEEVGVLSPLGRIWRTFYQLKSEVGVVPLTEEVESFLKAALTFLGPDGNVTQMRSKSGRTFPVIYGDRHFSRQYKAPAVPLPLVELANEYGKGSKSSC